MDKKLKQIKNEALELCAPVFHEMEEISLYNTQKVLEAFRKHHLSAYHFAPSYGYGYDDPGRGKLEEIWCDVFKCEAALVRPQFVSAPMPWGPSFSPSSNRAIPCSPPSALPMTPCRAS